MRLIAILLWAVSLAGQTVTCVLPKEPLLRDVAYACENSQQRPVWYSAFTQTHRLFVVLANPNRKVAYIALKTRSRNVFFYGSQQLTVWTWKDSQSIGWIRAEGTDAASH